MDLASTQDETYLYLSTQIDPFSITVLCLEAELIVSAKCILLLALLRHICNVTAATSPSEGS